MTEIPRISAPANRALSAADYHDLEDLAGVSAAALLALHGFGPKGVVIVNQALAAARLDPLR